MSDTNTDTDSLSQRGVFIPTPLVLVGNTLNFPPGSIINALASQVILNGQFLDSLQNYNIVQGTSLPNPNSVGPSVTRSAIISTRDSTLSGTGTLHTMSSSDTCDLIGGSYNSITSALSTDITGGNGCIARGSNGCLMTLSNGGTMNYSGLINSTTSNFTANTGTILNTNVLASLSSPAFAVSSRSLLRSLIAACGSCTLSANGGDLSECALVGSRSSAISSFAAGLVRSSAIAGSDSSNITGTTASGITTCFIGGSLSGTVSGTSTNTALIGSSTGNASATSDCVLTGTSPSVIGFSNVFCHAGNATQDNQAVFGTRVDLQGLSSDLQLDGGYVSSFSGFGSNSRTVTGATTLAQTDNWLRVNTTSSVQITIPTAASISARLRTGDSKTFRIINVETTTPSRLVTSGADVFNGLSGFTTFFLPTNFSAVELICFNTGTPFWCLKDASQSAYWEMTTTNNFGATPPLANASLMATSTSQATHQALGAASYTNFNTVTTSNTTLFNVTSNAIVTTVAGWYDVSVLLRPVTTSNINTNFNFRVDLLNGVSNTTVAQSYWQGAGQNDTSSNRDYVYSFYRVRLPAGTHRLRVSQENTIKFNNTMDVSYIKVALQGYF